MAVVGFVITVDGPAGAGKSSVAKRVAKRLGIRYLDTGAMYRAIAYTLDKKGVAPAENGELTRSVASLVVRLEGQGIFVNDENVTESIRSYRVDRVVSGYAALKTVRNALLNLQREQAEYGDLIADGRDTGTVVFPEADLKFFLTASPEARAERRYKELLRKGEAVLYKEVLTQIHERDRADSNREVAPLREPVEAIRLDTSSMAEDEVVNELAFIIQSRMA
ncbi:MAG: (d)CMP kinase [Synergistaceae bacterium]|nr:(d)CMP kinase [Synergistaceae bacterium]